MTLSSSYAVASGVKALTDGLYGLERPVGLSGALPFCMLRKVDGGAKSIGLLITESKSFSLCGVGKPCKGFGGGDRLSSCPLFVAPPA